MANLKGFSKSEALYYIADGWAKSDPAQAARWFNTNTSGELLEDAMGQILEAWGRQDPHEAFAWTDHLDEFIQASAMEGLAEGWGEIDPRSAAEAGIGLWNREYGDEFLITATHQWTRNNPPEVAAWAMGIQEDALRAAVQAEFAATWAGTDPVAAAAWVSELQNREAREAAEMKIAHAWSERDPGAAMDWAFDNLDDSNHARQVAKEIMLAWTDTDPHGAATWLNAREKGSQIDSILLAFSVSIVDLDPIAAVAWAREISDPAVRRTHVRELLGIWIAIGGQSARTVIRNLDLPELVKREFVEVR
jgi:hypothetical protein